MTIKLMKTTTYDQHQEKFMHLGNPVYLVVIVGRITELKILETFVSFMVEDGTGEQLCRFWYPETKPKDDYVDGNYYQIFGYYRKIGKEMIINVAKTHPIVDFDQVTFHGLHVIETYLIMTHGPKAKVALPAETGHEGIPGQVLEILNKEGGRNGIHWSTILQRLTDGKVQITPPELE
jgi:hypothetical protein